MSYARAGFRPRLCPTCREPPRFAQEILYCVNPRFSEYSETHSGEPGAEVTMAAYQTVAQRNLTCAIRIKERRRELGLTQAEIVDRVSSHGSRLSNQALSAIENGRRLAVGRLPDLAGALDCTVTYLLGLTTDPHRWPPDNPDNHTDAQAPAQTDTQVLAGTDAQAHAPTAAQTARDPIHAPRHSWILGPDVPDIPGELRARDAATIPRSQ
jgi:transcriptional regulator with XRE-family HTH domain